MTDEIVALARWLEGLVGPDAGEGQTDSFADEISFTEPCLSFQVEDRLSELVPLVVLMNREAGPEPDPRATTSLTTYLRLNLGREGIRQAAASLRAEATRFPIR
jgi:hypothetical protein